MHLVALSRTSDERRIAGYSLGGPRSGEEPDLGHRIVKCGNQFLDAGQHDMHGGQ
jgi:hypothetical protein